MYPSERLFPASLRFSRALVIPDAADLSDCGSELLMHKAFLNLKLLHLSPFSLM